VMYLSSKGQKFAVVKIGNLLLIHWGVCRTTVRIFRISAYHKDHSWDPYFSTFSRNAVVDSFK
jgi:hypothetical protein